MTRVESVVPGWTQVFCRQCLSVWTAHEEPCPDRCDSPTYCTHIRSGLCPRCDPYRIVYNQEDQ